MSDGLSIEQGIAHLPSGGKLYLTEEGEPIFPEGIVRMRPMTTQEEQLLASVKTRASRDQVMFSLVGKCIVDEDAAKMSIDDYLVGDVLYMLMVLRAVTWGPEYMFEVKCGECEKKFMVEIKTPEDLRVFAFGRDEEVSEAIKVDPLPISKAKLTVRLLKVSDEKAIAEYARKRGKDQTQVAPYRFGRHILTWDGKDMTPDEASKKYLKLHARDAEALRNAISDADCGIDLALSEECAFCGSENDVDFEFTSDFFSSKSSALRRRRRAAR